MRRDIYPRARALGHAARPALLALATLTSGCLTYRPIIVDRKTDFELQLLGTFERYQQRPSPNAGLAPRPRTTVAGADAGQALRAVVESELLRPEVWHGKQARLVGEGRDGLLVLLAPPAEEVERARLTRLVAQENAWRRWLMQAVIATDAALDARDLPEVQRVFHRLQLALSEPGELVQGGDGRWQPYAGGSGRGAAQDRLSR